MENQKDEQGIDLVYILSVIWRQIKNLFLLIRKWGVWCLRFIYKKRAYLVGALVCAIAFTMFWARPANRKFQMETEMHINVLDSYYFKDVVGILDYMCRSRDAVGLSKTLKLDLATAEKIKSVNAYYVVDKLCDGTPDEVCYGDYEADTTKQVMKDRLVVRIMLDDSLFIDTVGKALLSFCEDNEYVKSVNLQRIAQIDSRIQSLEKEMLMLDSLRKYEYFVKQSKEMRLEGPLIVSEKSQQLYYPDILLLVKQRDERMLERVVYSKAVHFVRDFVLMKEKNKYPRTFLYSFLVFAAIGLLIALFTLNKKDMKAFLEK